jgi:mRNA interferase RelE/StbE
MRTIFLQSFNRQLQNTTDKKLAIAVLSAIQIVKVSTKPESIPNLRKLKGHKQAYRIRIGRFRIGLFIDGDLAIFAAIAHRKDFYQRFP